MSSATRKATNRSAHTKNRFAWWPIALLVFIIFGLSLAAWYAFFQLGSNIDTHRLKPEEIPALLEKRALQEN